jgi:integrase
MGLGAAADVTLADVRDRADKLRKAKAAGRDPIVEKKVAAAKGNPKTFAQCMAEYIEAHGSKWRNGPAQLESMFNNHVPPNLRNLPVSEINKPLVLSVIKPIWETKRATARILRNKIESILDYAIAHEYRNGPNPAKWRENLKLILPDHSEDTRHHAAIPYSGVPDLMRALRSDTSIVSSALQFLILTAVRSNEACGATWDEIDLTNQVWRAARMKAGKEHRVPLSPPAVRIIEAMRLIRRGDLIFPGAHDGQMPGVTLARALKKHVPGATVHGMRSAFRDWCGDVSSAPREVAEAALAHAVGDDATEQAYLRASALEKRRVLMQQWASWCDGVRGGQSNVVELRA